MAKGAIIARIISEYSDKGTKAAEKDFLKLGKQVDEHAKKIKMAFGIATAAAAAFAVKIGVDSVKAAMEDQKSAALLNKTLQNTVGANESLIASVEEYIKKQELALGVNDSELRPSLAALTIATHDVTKAQQLQSLALDISAGRGKDLNAVSIALAKAYAGNFNQLKRLGIPLSENLIKSKDFVGITKELSAAVGGQAAVAANTFAGKLERVQLGFEEAKKSLGYALIPAVTNFLNLLNDKVLPAVEIWIDQNKNQLADALQKAGTYLGNFLKQLVEFGLWISKHTTEIQIFAAVIATMWVTTKIAAFVKAIYTISAAFTVLRNSAAAAYIAESLASGGLVTAAGAAAAGVAATTLAMYGLTHATNDQAKAVDKLSGMKSASQFYDAKAVENAKALQKQKQAQLVTEKQLTKAAQDKAAAEKVIAALKKMGVSVKSETDPIELEAARLNLVKQSNIEESNRVAAMMQAFEIQMQTNVAAQRYADILQVLADNQISYEEVSILASKWGLTTNQVQEYIARIFAANATPANSDAVLSLYMAWGLTKEQAQKYLDFAVALGDQKLSDAEIEKLRTKWGMTRDEVLAYAKKVQDGTIFSSTWADPGNAAKKSWEDALVALNTYVKAVTKGSEPILTSTGSTINAITGGDYSNVTSKGLGSVARGEYSDFTAPIVDAIQSTGMGAVSRGEYSDTVTSIINSVADTMIAASQSTMGGVGRGEYSVSGISSFGQSSVNNSASNATGNAGNTTIIIQGNAITQADNVAGMRDQLLGGYLSGKPMSFAVAAI